MGKPKPKPVPEQTHGPAYAAWGKGCTAEQSAAAMAGLHEGLRRACPVLRSNASNLYLNSGPAGGGVRDGFGRNDYEDFRPDDALPKTPRGSMEHCFRLYRDNSIVRNVIDLMSDFAVQGVDVSHPNKRVQAFFKEWWRRVDGPGRSERFLNLLYRVGNVLVRRHTTKLSPADEERMRRANASADQAMPPEEGSGLGPREIPIKYTFISPLAVELTNADVAPFMGEPHFRYELRVPAAVLKAARKAGKTGGLSFLDNLPPEVREALNSGVGKLPLDPEKVRPFFYKRDDWQPWASPMLHPLLGDFKMMEKMKLADMAALDGAISSIRVWKLGSLEHGIIPSPETFLRLSETLASNAGGGVLDFVWGPDLELKETSTEVHRFLGETKYAPVVRTIFQGLGVPASLSGDNKERGFTNNYFGLKVLVERLEYGRSILKLLWEDEFRIVQRALNFRFPASLMFSGILTDDAAEQQILLNMADRGLVSDETLQERMGLLPEIEDVRRRRESRRRESGLIPVKAGPFFDGNHQNILERSFASSGAYAPSQFGVELDPRAPGEKTPLQAQEAARPAPAPGQPAPAPPAGGPKGQTGQGRPPGKKDSSKRGRKKVNPRTSAVLAVLRTAPEATGASEDDLAALAEEVAASLGDSPPTPESVGAALLRRDSEKG